MRNPVVWAAFFPLILGCCSSNNPENVCGNGVLEINEACDDRNVVENDGCSSVCQIVLENCVDGIDNDNLADCDDMDCSQDSACLEANCDDGIDNNNNGVIDCQDFDCRNAPVCLVPFTCNFPEILEENSITKASTLGEEDRTEGNCDTGELGGSEVVFTVLPTVTGRMTVSMDSEASLLIYARTDCNDPSSEIGCSDLQPATFNEVFRSDVVAGEPVFIIVDGFDGDAGDFTLDIKTEEAQTENCKDGFDDDLDGATDCLDTDCNQTAICEVDNGVTVLDLGPVALEEVKTFEFPQGAQGFTILIEGKSSNFRTGVSRLVNPDGVVLIDDFISDVIRSRLNFNASALVMPQNDQVLDKMIPGVWEFAVNATSFEEIPNVKVLIRNGPFIESTLDLKLYLPQGIRACRDSNCNGGNGDIINASNATEFLEMQGTLNTFFEEFYADEVGFSEGNVQFFDLNSSFVMIETLAEFFSLNQQSIIGGPGGVHIFFMQGFGTSSGLGRSSGIPGAVTTAGNPSSGVVVRFQFDTDLFQNLTGKTMAHEIGHFLGLFHTTEFSGSPDFILDTPECPEETITGNILDCPDITFMMFPALVLVRKQISAGQVIPLRGGPIYR